MSIINMSLMAVPLIAAIATIRFFALYRLPKKTFCVMWGVVLYQLLVPFNIFSRLNVFAHLSALSNSVRERFVQTSYVSDIVSNSETTVNVADTPSAIVENAAPSAFLNIFETVDSFGRDMFGRLEMIGTSSADFVANTADSASLNISSIPLLPLIWLMGFLCCAAYFMITHMKFRRIYEQSLPTDSTFVRSWRVEYSDSMRRKVKIRQSDLIHSPLTYGIFHPVILLPKTTDYNDEAALKYILLHEYTHIWRFDTLAKLLLVIALCVHWFNPFVWLMYILANRDIELSCDEAVVRNTAVGKDTKSDYASTLITLAERKRMLSLGVNFSKNVMKERIRSIMKIKKQSASRIIAAVILISMVITLSATLQSCEDSAEPEFEIILDEHGEIVEIRELLPFEFEPFDMQESTDRLSSVDARIKR